MGKYKAYSKYKDSGVEWIEDIPEHWVMAKTSRFFKIGMGQTILKEDLVDDGEWPVFSATEGDHYLGRINNPNIKLDEGDIVIPARGNSIGSVKIVIEKSTTTQTTIYCKPYSKSSIFQRYAYFYLNGQRHNLFRFTQTAIPQITTEEVGGNPLILPTYNEQIAIANFLDHETAKIDTLIEHQQQLIQLLKEKRQAVISHAVTKGLNQNAPMKDSGVEWFGEVPAHWDCCLLKFKCLEVTDGAHISPETENGERLFVSITDIKKGVINFTDALLTSIKSYEYLVKTGCKPYPGDILFSKDGTIGQTAITPENVDFVVASSLIIIRPDRNKVTPEFLDLLLQSALVAEQVESFVKGAALRRLSIQNLLKVFGSFPPIDEQIQISSYLHKTLKHFDMLEEKASELIKFQQERRTALISATVTGKIDVRNWQAPNN